VKSLSSLSTTEIHAAVKVSKLLAESYIVHFERAQNKKAERSMEISDQTHNSESELSAGDEDSLLEMSETTGNKDLSSSEDESETSTSSKKSASSSTSTKTRKASKSISKPNPRLKKKQVSANTLTIPAAVPKKKRKKGAVAKEAGSSVTKVAGKRRRAGGSSAAADNEYGSDTESESASSGGPIIRQPLRKMLAKSLSAYETEELLRKTHEEGAFFSWVNNGRD